MELRHRNTYLEIGKLERNPSVSLKPPASAQLRYSLAETQVSYLAFVNHLLELLPRRIRVCCQLMDYLRLGVFFESDRPVKQCQTVVLGDRRTADGGLPVDEVKIHIIRLKTGETLVEHTFYLLRFMVVVPELVETGEMS